MKEIDGATPDCEIEGKQCLIPPLCEEGRKVINLHSLLTDLSGLVDAGTILKMYEADRNDIEYLALIAREIKKAQPAEPRETI